MDHIMDKKFDKIEKFIDIKNNYDAVIFDIWGVLHEGGELYEGVKELFNSLKKEKEVRIISNSPRLPETLAKNLSSLGLSVEEEIVYSSGRIARLMLVNSEKYFGIKDPAIFHIGGDRNTELLSNLDLKMANNIKDSELVVISSHRNEDEDISDIDAMLKEAANYNKPMFCANPDIDVIHLGGIRKCAGYFGKLYEKMGGKITYAGKPERLIFEECKKTLKAEFSRTLMIGDNFYTDIKGANLFGIASALVITGNMGIKLRKFYEGKDLLESINDICAAEEYLPNHIINLTS